MGIIENHKLNYKNVDFEFPFRLRGPAIWNDLIGSTEKEIQSSPDFKTKIISKLLKGTLMQI